MTHLKPAPYLHPLLHLLIGILFGAGLAISEMANPNAVLSFLDISSLFSQDSTFSPEGHWNPGLMFVMLAAISVGSVAYWLKRRRLLPVFSDRWRIPNTLALDKPLIMGAILFGIGWGLAGYCPGPALTALINNPQEGIYFIVAMLAGSFIFQVTQSRKQNT